jgi:hypothetical protein
MSNKRVGANKPHHVPNWHILPSWKDDISSFSCLLCYKTAQKDEISSFLTSDDQKDEISSLSTHTDEISSHRCYGRVDPHHLVTRGAGGTDLTLVPLCRLHHQELHTVGVETFQQRHGVNLWRELVRIIENNFEILVEAYLLAKQDHSLHHRGPGELPREPHEP